MCPLSYISSARVDLLSELHEWALCSAFKASIEGGTRARRLENFIFTSSFYRCRSGLLKQMTHRFSPDNSPSGSHTRGISFLPP